MSKSIAMTFEIAVIPFRTSIARRSSTRISGEGSTPTE